MKKTCITLVAALMAIAANALTYNVTVPEGTNACYLAGAMNSWSFTEMTKVDDTHYTIEAGEGEYKYTCGPAWKYVEKTADGEEMNNRTYSENDVVAKWAEVYTPSGNNPNPTDVKYYIKNNWNAGGWTWEEMSPNADKTEWSYTNVFGGTGVNINTEGSDSGAAWFPVDQIGGDAIAAGQKVTFTYNVAAKTVSAKVDGGNGGNTNPDPKPEGEGTYYYKGYINGADVNDDQVWNDFSEGIAEYDFTEKSYIFVVYQVHGVPGVQYMAESYVDGPSHATLVTSGQEKFAVPAGKGNLYLYDNGDGSLEISLEVIPGKTLVGGTPTALPQVTNTNSASKRIENGRVVIIRDGVRYSAQGARL